MNKAKLMKQYIALYGGYYQKNDGKWFWKKSTDSNEIFLVTYNFLYNKIQEIKTDKIKPKQEIVKSEHKKETKKSSKPKKKNPKNLIKIEENKQTETQQ